MTTTKVALLSQIFLPLVILLASGAVAWTEEPAEGPKVAGGTRVPIIHLYGSPAEKGRQLGEAIKESMPLLIEKYLMSFVASEETRKKFISQALQMEKHIPEEYIVEMKAAAEAAGVPYEQFLVASTFLDVSRTFFCSCFAVKNELTRDGKLIFGRNLDFFHRDIAHKHSLVVVYHGDGEHNSFVTVTWPGIIGALSGMNEAGLALAVMNVYGYRDSIDGIPYTILFRMILERCETVDEAIEMVKNAKRTAGNNLMLCDAKKNAVVIEMTADEIGVRRIKNNSLVSTNHFRTKKLARLKFCSRYETLAGSIEQHRDAIARARENAAKEMEKIDVPAAQEMLSKVAVNFKHYVTMQSIVFLPETREMYLAAGELPATKGVFHLYNLRELFAEQKEKAVPEDRKKDANTEQEMEQASGEKKEETLGCEKSAVPAARIPLRVRRPPREPERPTPWLGVSVQLPTKPITEYGGKEDEAGVKVVVVVPNAPADIAGVKVGDIIVAIGDTPLKDPARPDANAVAVFVSTIRALQVGEKKTLTVLREGKRETLEAVIGQRTPIEIKSRAHPEFDKLHAAKETSLLEDALASQNLTDEFLSVEAMVRATAGYSASQVELMPGQPDPFRLTEINYLLQNPLDTHLVCDGLARALETAVSDPAAGPPLAAALHRMAERLDCKVSTEVRMPMEGSEFPPIHAHDFLRAQLITPRMALSNARMALRRAFRGLDKTELDCLRMNADILGERDVPPGDVLAAMKAAAKVDYDALVTAGWNLARLYSPKTLATLRTALEKYEALAGMPKEPAGITGEILYREMTDEGLVIVGGKGCNTYSTDAALIVDLGGDDAYYNNAGASTEKIPVAIVIDYAGNDTYAANRDFVQGTGFLGVGFIFDLEGNDSYTGQSFAQGCGIWGVGAIVDGAGDDCYRADTCAQGAGMFGLGLILEGGGADRYHGHKHVQGFGFTKGFGAIIEVAGADLYFAGGKYFDFREPEKAYQSLSQGFGFGLRPWGEMSVGTSGGIGMIVDMAGHDNYIGDYFCQGSSYWYSLGALVDRKGCDRYWASRYSQGAGIHLSLGALVDDEGDDIYACSSIGVSQGCGHDWAVGILADRAGNDTYFGAWSTQGAGNDNGIGILLDFGGNDTYWARTESQGRGNWLEGRGNGSFGVLLDGGGGTDSYNLGGKDDTVSSKTQWGILLDTRDTIRDFAEE